MVSAAAAEGALVTAEAAAEAASAVAEATVAAEEVISHNSNLLNLTTY